MVEAYPIEAAYNAIQATINANDAFTIAILGKRAGADHREAMLLHKEAAGKIGGDNMIDILKSELAARSPTGYDVKVIIHKEDAKKLIKRAEIFIRWVEGKIVNA